MGFAEARVSLENPRKKHFHCKINEIYDSNETVSNDQEQPVLQSQCPQKH